MQKLILNGLNQRADQNWTSTEIAFVLYCLELYARLYSNKKYKTQFVSIYMKDSGSGDFEEIEGDPRDNLKTLLFRVFEIEAKSELLKINLLKAISPGTAENVLLDKNLKNQESVTNEYNTLMQHNAACNGGVIEWNLEGSTSFDVVYGENFMRLWNRLK